jgi:hypothetical protein
MEKTWINVSQRCLHRMKMTLRNTEAKYSLESHATQTHIFAFCMVFVSIKGQGCSPEHKCHGDLVRTPMRIPIWGHSHCVHNDSLALLIAELYDKQLKKIAYLNKLTFEPQKERLLINQVISSYIFFACKSGRQRGRSSSPGRVKNFLFSTSFRSALGPTQLPIQWIPEAFSSGKKRQGREADHSPPTSPEVKKMWIYTFTPPYAFMA